METGLKLVECVQMDANICIYVYIYLSTYIQIYIYTNIYGNRS